MGISARVKSMNKFSPITERFLEDELHKSSEDLGPEIVWSDLISLSEVSSRPHKPIPPNTLTNNTSRVIYDSIMGLSIRNARSRSAPHNTKIIEARTAAVFNSLVSSILVDILARQEYTKREFKILDEYFMYLELGYSIEDVENLGLSTTDLRIEQVIKSRTKPEARQKIQHGLTDRSSVRTMIINDDGEVEVVGVDMELGEDLIKSLQEASLAEHKENKLIADAMKEIYSLLLKA